MTKANSFITGVGGAWLNNALLAIVVFFSIKLYDDVREGFKRMDAIEVQSAVHEWRLDHLTDAH